jgi:pimeloyl-ACP methyl ester carboxylesterase
LGGIKYLDATKSTGYVTEWAGVLDTLVNNANYVADVDIRAATYDWRLGPDALEAGGWMDATEALLKSMSDAAGSPVVVVSFSMGGPVASLFLDRLSLAFKSKYIAAYVSIAGAFGGSTWTPMCLISTGIQLYPGVTTINEDLLQGVMANWGGAAWMTPNLKTFPANQVWFTKGGKTLNGDRIRTSTLRCNVGVNYTTSMMPQLYRDAGINNGENMIKTVMAPEYQIFNASLGVPVYCVFGYNVSTPLRIDYGTNWSVPVGGAVGDGDGTVLEAGLRNQCVQWGAKLIPIANLAHDDGLKNPDSLTLVYSVLNVL